MDILSAIWAFLGFAAGLAWSLVWFILRDLISTAVWLLIALWLVLSVRYRSFASGTSAMLRYGTFGLRLLWRWMRGGMAGNRVIAAAQPHHIERLAERRRVPLGYMSISEQLNMAFVGAMAVILLN